MNDHHTLIKHHQFQSISLIFHVFSLFFQCSHAFYNKIFGMAQDYNQGFLFPIGELIEGEGYHFGNSSGDFFYQYDNNESIMDCITLQPPCQDHVAEDPPLETKLTPGQHDIIIQDGAQGNPRNDNLEIDSNQCTPSQDIQRPRPKPQKRKRKTKQVKSKEQNASKNIDCYISKCGISLFVTTESPYKDIVESLCKQFNCPLKYLNNLRSKSIPTWFGITKINDYIRKPHIGKVFSAFLRWLLREKYMAHLILSNRVQHIKMYTKIKNLLLLYLDFPEIQESSLNLQFYNASLDCKKLQMNQISCSLKKFSNVQINDKF